MGIGPCPAIKTALERGGKTLNDMSLVEVRAIVTKKRGPRFEIWKNIQCAVIEIYLSIASRFEG